MKSPYAISFTVLVTAACLLLTPRVTLSQATGQITGLITDSSGSAVVNATVTVMNQATRQTRTVASGSDGFFIVPIVNPGMYQVTASMAGFSTQVRDNIEVVVSGISRTDFTLQVGQISEQVTVQGAAPLVETRNATM